VYGVAGFAGGTLRGVAAERRFDSVGGDSPNGVEETMADRNIELTRRKILASAGAVGAAGVGAGLGTSALFSDEESFVNNEITAGTLDMVVDWEEHYSYPQLYGIEDPTSGLETTMSEPDNPDEYTAFPPGANDPILWVHDEDVDAYMDATAIDAFPDEDNDGAQDEFDGEDACSVLPDLAGGDGGLSDSMRTRRDGVTEEGDPLIQLDDVKPGDFGEVTLSFHLCDNPGYVWLNADNVGWAENGTNEPEASASGEGERPEVELLDEIQTAWWYDENCNNLTDTSQGGGDEVDLVIVLDESGSMDSGSGSALESAKNGAKTLVDAVGPDVRTSLVTFDDQEDTGLRANLAESNSDVKDAIDDVPYNSSGSTAIGEGIAVGQDHLQNGTGARSGAEKVMVVLADGGENEGTDPVGEASSAKNDGTTIYSIAYTDGADEDLMEDISTNPTDDGTIDDQDPYAYLADQADIGDVFDDIGTSVSQGEEIFFQGSLRRAVDALQYGAGIPLDGDGGDDFDEFSDPATADSRGCFEATPETNCIGFSWWVPPEVGNEIQSDSVSFDLGFYTEQCRNNDGSAGNA